MERECSPLLLYQLGPWPAFDVNFGGMIRNNNFSARQILSSIGETSTKKHNRYLFARNQNFNLIHQPASVKNPTASWRSLSSRRPPSTLEANEWVQRTLCMRDWIYWVTMTRLHIKIELWLTICSNQSKKPTPYSVTSSGSYLPSLTCKESNYFQNIVQEVKHEPTNPYNNWPKTIRAWSISDSFPNFCICFQLRTNQKKTSMHL